LLLYLQPHFFPMNQCCNIFFSDHCSKLFLFSGLIPRRKTVYIISQMLRVFAGRGPRSDAGIDPSGTARSSDDKGSPLGLSSTVWDTVRLLNTGLRQSMLKPSRSRVVLGWNDVSNPAWRRRTDRRTMQVPHNGMQQI
jgi:hypothetical protein